MIENNILPVKPKIKKKVFVVMATEDYTRKVVGVFSNQKRAEKVLMLGPHARFLMIHMLNETDYGLFA